MNDYAQIDIQKLTILYRRMILVKYYFLHFRIERLVIRYQFEFLRKKIIFNPGGCPMKGD